MHLKAIELKNDLNKKGNRLTKQRLVILEYLKSVTCHPTAEIIYTNVRKNLPNISLGTVYRNLHYLTDNNYIIEIKSKDGFAHYDGNTDYHLHFICQKCNEIIDIFDTKYIKFNDLSDFGKINSIETNLYGVCKKCI